MSKKLEAVVRGIVTRVISKYQPSSYGPLTPTLGLRLLRKWSRTQNDINTSHQSLSLLQSYHPMPPCLEKFRRGFKQSQLNNYVAGTVEGSVTCEQCNEVPETSLHALWSCPDTKKKWRDLGTRNTANYFGIYR
ncbi:hypothetical protein CMV_023794 [Castanea mollissima]|uniref:Uncharacterized protein n=1 Tax=Castanea mollissima TaxID=60419 RepID=A0A8J4VIK5_9ROSI|nr:hypothetical protein CMV_023794 [Castanea mollissima]